MAVSSGDGTNPRDPWVIATVREHGVEPDDDALVVRCAGWPLLIGILPPFSRTYGRILILGSNQAALFTADGAVRETPKKLLWSGLAGDLSWRKVMRLVRGETPTGERVYLDSPTEQERVRALLGETA